VRSESVRVSNSRETRATTRRGHGSIYPVCIWN
jgi:hypothetical protein